MFVHRITLDPSLSLPPFAGVDSYSDVGPHHEIDMDRPYPEGLDDSRRPTVDCEYTGCPRRNVQYFGRVFLMLNYADITQNTYIQS